MSISQLGPTNSSRRAGEMSAADLSLCPLRFASLADALARELGSFKQALRRSTKGAQMADSPAKTIVITGASSGIGKATARLFFDRGWNVVATMRSPAGERDLKDEARLKLVALDVQDPEGPKTAVAEAIKAYGRIDVWLNNAGYGAFGPVEAGRASRSSGSSASTCSASSPASRRSPRISVSKKLAFWSTFRRSAGS